MNQTQATTQLSTMLSDTLQQISVDRLAQAIKSAWNDGYVSIQAYDSSLTFLASTFEYTIPDSLNVVDSIYVNYSSSNAPDPISADLWEIVDGKIHFHNAITGVMSAGNTITLRGKYKLTSSDDIPDEYPTLQEYVLTLAAWIVLKQMGFTKVLSFLHNDTSMSELIGFRREIERDVKSLRTQLVTSYVDN